MTNPFALVTNTITSHQPTNGFVERERERQRDILIAKCKQTCANVVRNASNERFGGRQNFLPDSWQHTFGKQSNVVLHGFGNKSNTGAGAGVHCRYEDSVSIAVEFESFHR